jgi:hypothetical protein
MRKLLNQLPPNMAERATTARKIACSNPEAVDVDDEMLPWVFDEASNLWLSFDGNYSASSPTQKRQRDLARQVSEEEMAEKSLERALEKEATDLAWSRRREMVLERDNYACQLCGLVGFTRFHIHHVLKRTEGGTDHLDNLVTVCPKCHKAADTRLYNPDWTVPPQAPEAN